MTQPTQELKKELLPSLKKGLQRIAAQEDPVFKYAMSLKERDANLSDEEAYKIAEEILSREATPRVRTEDDDEELKAWKAVVYATVAKVFGALPEGQAIFQKEFESQIKDVTQPQGGTENLTNVRSPGQPPAKIPAEPGRSGRNTNGSYRTDDDVDGTQRGFTYDVSPGSPRGNPQPNHRLNRPSPGQNWDQVGPVGERGDLASIPTYETRIIPGKIAPSEQYRGTGPTPRVPSREMPEGGNIERPTIHNQPSYPDIDTSVTAKAFGSATDRREAEQLMGKAFAQALDQADANGPHPMDFDLRRASVGMGTVKQVTPDVVSKTFLNKEWERRTKPTKISSQQSTDTAADEEQFDYAHFQRADQLEKQASGMRRLARDQEIAGNFAGRDDLKHKALLLDREAAEIRKQVHEPSLNRTLRTVLSKPVK